MIFGSKHNDFTQACASENIFCKMAWTKCINKSGIFLSAWGNCCFLVIKAYCSFDGGLIISLSSSKIVNFIILYLFGMLHEGTNPLHEQML